MKTVLYALHLPEGLYRRVQVEAGQRGKSISQLLREVIRHGLAALPPLTQSSRIVADTWENLGPAPEVDYRRL